VERCREGCSTRVTINQNEEKAADAALVVADDLRAGVLHPDQLPIDAFDYKGKLVSANTRSLSALSEAGLEPTKINLIKPSRALLRRLGEDPLLPNAPLPGPRVPVTPTQNDLTILRVIEIPRPGQ
jgi:hypothetical protein